MLRPSRAVRINPLKIVGCASIWLSVLLGFNAIAMHASKFSRRDDDTKEKSHPASPTKLDTSVNTGVLPGMEIADHGGYPELRVDGRPFFIHSAAFFYYRIPSDLWPSLLDRYRQLGINTLDIYVPWNWHEPADGQFDFDGHTNPRRDLRRLLGLIKERGFKLIARPGPEILNEWRHGGYPGWLLERPEYKMSPLDWVEGRYPPLDSLNVRDAEEAARGWLDNPVHMEHTRAWLTAVAKELAPYSSQAAADGEKRDNREGGPARDSGPLLFVQVGDDFAIGRTNRVGPEFWRYVEELRGMLVNAGLDTTVFINPTDMRLSGEGSAQNPPVGVMGQWYMQPGDSTSKRAPDSLLTSRDASEIEFFTEELKTQPDFPPALIEYQAGWYTPADDDRPRPTLPENTLLSSRLLIGNGIHGLNYFPLQDTFTPAGYSVPWANRSYRWDAALGPDGLLQPKGHAVRRNEQFLERWGPILAASHKRADFGIVYPLGSYPQESLTAHDIASVSESVMRIERLGVLAMLSSELVDPEFQNVSQILRDPLLLLPVFDRERPQFQLSERVQREIVEYVRRGGKLVIFPTLPAGDTVGELWKKAPQTTEPSAESPIRAKWEFGDGEVIESSKDFYSWISLDESLAGNKAHPEFHWAASVLERFLAAAEVRPALRLADQAHGAEDLIASEIVSNQGTGMLGSRSGGEGFVSLTNLSPDSAAEGTLEILLPSLSATEKRQNYTSLKIVVPPRDSLLLPLEIPLCAAGLKNDPCTNNLTAAAAEFLKAEREGKTLQLSFYVPARADVELQLDDKPSRVQLDETDAHPDSSWFPTNREFLLTIPRGAAPDFVRTLKIEMPHPPQAQSEKRNQPSKAPPEDLECYVANAFRFPTSGNAFLRTVPALVFPDPDQKINVVLIAENRNPSANGYIDLSFDKPLHGPKNLVVPPRGSTSEVIEFRGNDIQGSGAASSSDHLFHTAIEVHVGHDRRVLPLAFLLHQTDAQEHYRFDFDRDGLDEWVLENDQLRLIASPESGGRAVALVDKLTGANLSTSVGLFRDAFSFAENPQGINESRRRGKYGLSNRTYAAEWGPDPAHPSLKLHYDAPDVFPGGARIEKTLQFDDAGTVKASYKITLLPKANDASQSESQSFVAINSFPAEAERSGASTLFCWTRTAEPSPPAANKGSESEPETCEDFVRDGKPIGVPEGISKIEIRSAGRPEIEISWDCGKSCGQMTIEPQYFSALFRLALPPLLPGAGTASYAMRIRVVRAR